MPEDLVVASPVGDPNGVYSALSHCFRDFVCLLLQFESLSAIGDCTLREATPAGLLPNLDQ